jgi:hypothetical protein
LVEDEDEQGAEGMDARVCDRSGGTQAGAGRAEPESSGGARVAPGLPGGEDEGARLRMHSITAYVAKPESSVIP